MQGLHLTSDLLECRCEKRWLVDAQLLGSACVASVEAAGLMVVGQLFHSFPATPLGAGGVTATVLLAESHLCVHTWPEQAGVTIDVYVCNFGGDHSSRARTLMADLEALFVPSRVERHALHRGAMPAEAVLAP